MSKSDIKIAVDALGGDHAPEQVILGAVDSGVPVTLVGPEPALVATLRGVGNTDHIDIVNATELIGNDDHPLSAVRGKKDSSMTVAINLVSEGMAAGVMSAGNTGAFMLGATMILGRLPEVTRPAAAIPVPTPSGTSLLLDAGASTDCTARDLVNFGVMGSTYANTVWQIDNPKVGLLSIGEEEGKGSKQAKEVFQKFKQSDLNFVGNVQGSDLVTTAADVIVSDGFTGNVALKSAEGISMLIMKVVEDELRGTSGVEKLATWVLYPLLRRVKKRLDWREYGGGSLLGVRGNVVIAHGKSKRRAIASAVKLTYDLAQTELLLRLDESLKGHYQKGIED